MADNYGDLLEKGAAPARASISVDHPSRKKKYRCDDCGDFVWAFRLADMRKVPAVLKGGIASVDFVCDGCFAIYERGHDAAQRRQPQISGSKAWRGLAPTQGSGWRAKQKDYRDQIKAAQEAG